MVRVSPLIISVMVFIDPTSYAPASLQIKSAGNGIAQAGRITEPTNLYNGQMSEMEQLKQRLRAVYSETTVDHVLHPRNERPIPNPDGFAEHRNGPEIMKVWLKVKDDVIVDAGFWTNGCAATIACGSMSTDLAKGRPVVEALSITAQDIAEALEDLSEGNFHCAEFAAQALRAALRDCLITRQQPWKKLYR